MVFDYASNAIVSKRSSHLMKSISRSGTHQAWGVSWTCMLATPTTAAECMYDYLMKLDAYAYDKFVVFSLTKNH